MVESLVLLRWKHTIHLPLCLFLHHTIHSLQRALRMPLASGPRLPEMGKRRGGRTANCAPRSTGHTATITRCSSSWRLDPLQRLAAWVLDVVEHGIIKLIEQQSMDSSVQQLARNLTPMKRDCPWNAILAPFHTITAGSSRTRPSIGSGQSHGCKAAFPCPHSIARLAWWSCATSLYNGFDPRWRRRRYGGGGRDCMRVHRRAIVCAHRCPVIFVGPGHVAPSNRRFPAVEMNVSGDEHRTNLACLHFSPSLSPATCLQFSDQLPSASPNTLNLFRCAV